MDDLVTCPYNIAHSIRRSRLQYHLHRCRRNYPEVLAVCKYNVTHHIRAEEMMMHLASCPDKAEVEARKWEEMMNKCKGGFRNLPRPSTPPMIEADEDWDVEAKKSGIQNSYDPIAASMKKEVVRNPPSVPPAQRKAFREAEKKRLEELKEKAAKNSKNHNRYED